MGKWRFALRNSENSRIIGFSLCQSIECHRIKGGMTPSQQFFPNNTFLMKYFGRALRNVSQTCVEKFAESMALSVARRRRGALKGEIFCYPTIARPGAAFLCYFIDFFSLHFFIFVIFLFQGDSQAGVHASLASTGMFAIDCRRRVSSLR